MPQSPVPGCKAMWVDGGPMVLGEYPRAFSSFSYIKRKEKKENLIIGLLKGRWVHEMQL